MNNDMKNIFLGGGGDQYASRALDQSFVNALDLSQNLLYFPHAMDLEKFASCEAWAWSVFHPLGLDHIQIADLEKDLPSFTEISGIYIGGGNTIRLLQALRTSGGDKYIDSFISEGGAVYGGSAGAIFLGKTIRTAVEATGLIVNADDHGLDVLYGHAVVCHYDGKEDLGRLSRELDLPIIALQETSGVKLSGRRLISLGPGDVWIFSPNRLCISVGQSVDLI